MQRFSIKQHLNGNVTQLQLANYSQIKFLFKRKSERSGSMDANVLSSLKDASLSS